MISQFALRLLSGISGMWMLMPRAAVSSGFFRIQMLLGLGLGVLATLTISPAAIDEPVGGESRLWILRGAGGALSACSFIGSVLWTLERRRAATVCCALVWGLSTALMLAGMHLPTIDASQSDPLARWWIGRAVELSSAAILGSSMTAMLLGHWYLTSPTMSLSVLGRLNNFYGISILFRMTIASIGLCGGWEHLHGGLPMIWLIFRWIAGFIGPIAACLMVKNILRYKNTQSATGVLFGSVILVFIGELLAVLLSRELQYPM